MSHLHELAQGRPSVRDIECFALLSCGLLSCNAQESTDVAHLQHPDAPMTPLDASAPLVTLRVDSGPAPGAQPRLLYFDDPVERDTDDLPLDTDFDADGCPALDVELFRAEAEYRSSRGVLVKLLQYPEYTDENRARDPVAFTDSTPQSWDTSEFPAGACIMRLRGIRAGCYAHSESKLGTFPFEFNSYYFHQAQNDTVCPWPPPGCPRAGWGMPSIQSSWWYLSQRDDDVLLVACVDLCQRSFGPSAFGPLRLVPPSNGASSCSLDGGT